MELVKMRKLTVVAESSAYEKIMRLLADLGVEDCFAVEWSGDVPAAGSLTGVHRGCVRVEATLDDQVVSKVFEKVSFDLSRAMLAPLRVSDIWTPMTDRPKISSAGRASAKSVEWMDGFISL